MTFTPPERWPFQGGEAIYYLPSNQSNIRPTVYIPAIVLSCQNFKGLLRCGKASIQRSDKPRPSSVSPSSLVYRGYCAACEVPAIEGTGGALICPRCQEKAIALPPPDELVVRWYPLDQYREPRVMRFQIQHPTWSWNAAREAADAVFDTAYEGMLERLGLRRLYNSSDYSLDAIADYHINSRLLNILSAAALLGDDALFLSTHQELSARQAETSRSRYLARRLLALSPERLLDLLGDLREEEADEPPPPPPTVSFIPLPERPESDAEPDGADDMTRWLEQQFKKRAA